VNAAKNKNNTYKVGKSFVIDCTTRFDKNMRYIFTDCYRKWSTIPACMSISMDHWILVSCKEHY